MAPPFFFSQIWSLFGSCRMFETWNLQKLKGSQDFVCKDDHSKTIQAPKNDGVKKTSCWDGGMVSGAQLAISAFEKLLEPRIRNCMLSYFGDAFPVSFLDIPKKMNMNSNTRLPPKLEIPASLQFGLNLLPTSIGICKNSTISKLPRVACKIPCGRGSRWGHHRTFWLKSQSGSSIQRNILGPLAIVISLANVFQIRGPLFG